MSKKLLFAAIASILATGAFADPATITTQDYVDAQDALKQNIITTGLVDLYGGVYGSGVDQMVPAIVTTNSTGTTLTGNTIGILDHENADNEDATGGLRYYTDRTLSDDGFNPTRFDNFIPTVRAVGNALGDLWENKQEQILGHSLGEPDSILTDSTDPGVVGRRAIYDNTNANYSPTDDATKIPTMGAVMAAISNNQVTLPTGTAGNVVTYNSNGAIGGSVATYNGSTTYNASTDASKIAVMSAVQRKMTCNRYLENAAQTPENCLLWNVPD